MDTEMNEWKQLRDQWQLAMDTPVWVYKRVSVNNDGTFEGGFCHRFPGTKKLRTMRRGRDFCEAQLRDLEASRTNEGGK